MTATKTITTSTPPLKPEVTAPVFTSHSIDIYMRHYKLLRNVVFTIKKKSNEPGVDLKFQRYQNYSQKRAIAKGIELLAEFRDRYGVEKIDSRTSIIITQNIPPIKNVDFKTHGFDMTDMHHEMLRGVVTSMHQAGKLHFNLKRATGLAIELLSESIQKNGFVIEELSEELKEKSELLSTSIKAGIIRKKQGAPQLELPTVTRASKAEDFDFG